MKFDSFNLWKWLTLVGEPLSIVTCLLVLGCLLSWFSRGRKAGRVLLSAARVLEGHYRPVVAAQTAANVKWTGVLGGCHVRLYRAIPGSRILFSGGSIYDRTPEAQASREVAVELGVSPLQIATEPRPRTTADFRDV